MFGTRIENNGLVFDNSLPEPSLKEGELLIETAYAGVNRADLFQIQGKYPPPEGASLLPGLEISGTVVKKAEDVNEFAVGDKVCALLEGGGYAQYASVRATQCLPIPDGWNLRDAASLPEALFTIWLALFDHAKLQKGETILIHAGASSIGSMATQISRAIGAKIVTTAGTDEKCAHSISLGAHASYNYTQQDFELLINHVFGGVDVIIDFVGGDYFAKNLRLLNPFGRMVSLAFLQSAKAEISHAPLLLKQLTWSGMALRSRSAEQKAVVARNVQEKLYPLLLSGKIISTIDSEFTLENASKALEKMQQNLNIGKILLKA